MFDTAHATAPQTSWAAVSREDRPTAAGRSIDDGAEVDVAIVGAGYTGLNAARALASAGRSVAVFEARQVGHGGSGRNVGLVNAGVWLPPEAVRRALGSEAGGRFLELFGDAPRRVFELIERHQIQCAAQRVGTLHAAHAPSGLRELRRRAEAWRALGAPVRLLDAAEAAEAIGSRAFHGALCDARAGVLNPVAFCLGLARVAQAAGAEIYEDAPVAGLTRDGARWRVETARGTVRASAVILAANAYADGLWPGLERSFVGLDYVQIATEPLGARSDGVLAGGRGLWSTAKIMISLRRDADGRLILGSMGRAHGGPERGLTRRWAEQTLRRLFPQIGAPAFETMWSGKIAMTSEHLPRILRLAENVYAPTAYNGRGITTGLVFGEAVGELVATGDAAASPAPVVPLTREPARRLRETAFRAAFAANQLAGALR